MNGFERRLHSRFSEVENLSEITPGVVVDVHYRGRRIGMLREGRTWKYYDLASLTKIIFGASTSLLYFSEHRRELNRPINHVLPWWKPSTTPADLLSHTAGLEWWLPMYKRLRGPLDPEKRWAQMMQQLRKIKPKKRRKAVYSDVDLWMLGAYLQVAEEKSLLKIWNETAERNGTRGIFFHPGNKPKFARANYAPTEKSPWHGRILQGEVHDENTWALGGVALNAGLFAPIEAVSAWGMNLRKAYLGKSARFGDEQLVKYFVNRRIPRALGDWGLGFMKPSLQRASAGSHFSLRSFGHTGFTGTSLWYDPARDLQVVILSNRVHPTRENQRFVQLRPMIHNWVCESLR